ncbi:hypothetical protein [Micromonospora sp. NPDC005237]|uniref:hypothetical protein n=1 Tax=Micromonospora sp. NPDC005237 TaxID=3155113 RepID=UPI0033B90594
MEIISTLLSHLTGLQLEAVAVQAEQADNWHVKHPRSTQIPPHAPQPKLNCDHNPAGVAAP